MKKFIALFLAIALVAAVAAFAEDFDVSAIINTKTDKTQTITPFTDVITNVKNSVVGINNYQNYTYNSGRNNNFNFGFGFGFGYGDGSEGETKTEERLAGSGSGVVIYTEYVLTNYHVIENISPEFFIIFN